MRGSRLCGCAGAGEAAGTARPIRDECLIADGGGLAGTGAHAYAG